MTDAFQFGPHRVQVLYDGDDFGLLEGRFVPGIPGPPPHRHDWAEGFYVVSGSLAVTVDGDEQALTAGDFAMAPGGSLHTFAVTGTAGTVFVATFSTRNGIAYLREMAGILTPQGPDPDRLAALHDRYGVSTT